MLGRDYPVDSETNVSSHLLKHTDKLLHHRKHHPIQIVKQRIVENMQVINMRKLIPEIDYDILNIVLIIISECVRQSNLTLILLSPEKPAP